MFSSGRRIQAKPYGLSACSNTQRTEGDAEEAHRSSTIVYTADPKNPSTPCKPDEMTSTLSASSVAEEATSIVNSSPPGPTAAMGYASSLQPIRCAALAKTCAGGSVLGGKYRRKSHVMLFWQLRRLRRGAPATDRLREARLIGSIRSASRGRREWRERQEGGEARRLSRQGRAGQRAVGRDLAAIRVAFWPRLAEAVRRPRGGVDHPHLGNAMPCVERHLHSEVVGEARLGDLDDQEGVGRAGMGRGIVVGPRREQRGSTPPRRQPWIRRSSDVCDGRKRRQERVRNLFRIRCTGSGPEGPGTCRSLGRRSRVR